MAAVSLRSAELERVLVDFPGVEIAAVNAPELCTVSGPADAIAALGQKLTATASGFRALHTSHAFHSAMMEPALAPFTALLQGVALSPPNIPYVSNLTGTWITAAQATSPEYYAQHLRHAVRFEAGVRAIAADPTVLLLEVGPGNALTSLARMTVGKDANARVISSLSHPRDRRSDVEATLEATGRMWLAGAEIDWNGMHADSAPRRVPLPTYPFDRKRHWVDATPVEPKAAAAAMKPSEHVDDWMFAPTWTRDDARPAASALTGTWLVFGTSEPLSDAVVRAARGAGAHVALIEPGIQYERRDGAPPDALRYAVRPADADDLSKVLKDLAAADQRIAGVIDLWNTSASDESGLVTTHHALVTAAAALEPLREASDPLPIIVATVGLQSVLDEPIRFPERAAVLGPVLALPTEIPTLRMRAVDLDLLDDRGDGTAKASVERAAAALVEEAATPDRESVVARRSGRRWVRRVERIAVPAFDPDLQMLKPHGVYLITGGLGGIGLTLAEWLARRTSARLLLTSRTPLPERDAWDAWLAAHPETDRTSIAINGIRRIEAAGGEVLTAAVHASNERAMHAALELAHARWGSINGVVHAAGIAGNGRVALLTTSEEVGAVIAPKAHGLDVLRTLLGDTDLDFVVLISSINALFGSPGLVDYGSANAMLDAFVDSTRRPSRWRHVAAINFGPWRDVGMAARIFEKSDDRRGASEEFRQAAIPPAAGAEAFERILLSRRSHVIVARQDLPRAMELARTAPRPSSANGADAAHAAAVAMDTLAIDGAGAEAPANFEAPASDDETRIAKIWSELLGVDRVGANDDFFELGGHSLLATRVLARIDQAMGVRLALRDVFDAPTLRTLAARVGAARPKPDHTISADDPDREELEF